MALGAGACSAAVGSVHFEASQKHTAAMTFRLTTAPSARPAESPAPDEIREESCKQRAKASADEIDHQLLYCCDSTAHL